jgi:Thioredoxin-like
MQAEKNESGEMVVDSGFMNARGVSKQSVSVVPSSLPAFSKRSIPKLPASLPGQETPMEIILGPKLYKQGTLSVATTVSACAGQELVMLYFASAWRRECKEFNSHLLDFYKKCSVQEKIECVYVSSDRNLQEFKAFFAQLPYFSMPTQTAALKNAMAKNLKIVDMPSLVVLDPTSGLVVTTDGVGDIEKLGKCDLSQCQALARTWKACVTPIPIEDVIGDTRLKHGTMDRGFLYWHE